MYDKRSPQRLSPQGTPWLYRRWPGYGGGCGPAWGCAYIIIAWCMYLYYEDTEILKDHYDGMKKWIGYLTSRTDGDYIIHREEPGSWFLGDWCTPDEIVLPPELVSTYHIITTQRLILCQKWLIFSITTMMPGITATFAKR